jgi:ABC-type dipeptide/oligopeptide/nickel transport system permease component
LLRSLLVLVGVTVVVFALVRVIPGDPVRLMLPPDATEQDVEILREQLGFNEPLYRQYLLFMQGVLTGDLGKSLRFRRPVSELVWERLPATIELALAGTFLTIIIGIPAGVLAAWKRNSFYDSFFMFLTMVGQSVPIFWLGIMLILFFSVNLRLLPTSGRGSLAQLIMPSVTLATFFMALVARLTRSSVLEILGQPYVQTARAKGLSEYLVMGRHVLKNALLPVVTILGLQVGVLLGGAVITETVFAWPGIGTLAVGAIYNRDYPLVQGTVLIAAGIFVVINIVVDLLYLFLDPRIRYQ